MKESQQVDDSQNKDASTEVAQVQEGNAPVTQSANPQFPAYNLSGGDVPDLSKAEVVPLDLTEEYWTPEKEGESKRMFFDGVRTRSSINPETGELTTSETVYFFENRGGNLITICNSSARLVGSFENSGIERGTPWLVTYTGKKKNKNNAFSSDTWSVKPLLIKL